MITDTAPPAPTLLDRAMRAAGYNVKTVDVTDWKALYIKAGQEIEALRSEINRLQHRLASKTPTYCAEFEQALPTKSSKAGDSV